MDDILIFVETPKAEHYTFIEKRQQQDIKHELEVNITESEFYVHKTIFLGIFVNRSQVQMDINKLEMISTWPLRTT